MSFLKHLLLLQCPNMPLHHSYAVKALKLFNDIRHFLSTPGILEPKYCERV